jgi:hypothetical protein
MTVATVAAEGVSERLGVDKLGMQFGRFEHRAA